MPYQITSWGRKQTASSKTNAIKIVRSMFSGRIGTYYNRRLSGNWTSIDVYDSNNPEHEVEITKITE